jgi:hypothetical protein
MNKLRIFRVPIFISTVTIAAVLIAAPALAQMPISSQEITSGRPLSEAAMLLSGRFAKPVTYEDPIWMWGGDARPSPVARGLYPRDLKFSLPEQLFTAQKAELNLDLIAKIVDAYHRDTDGPRFRVLSSRWGFHIVPVQVRDSTGRWVSVSALLDTQINIPVENRTPSMHFVQICNVLTTASGIRVIPGASWLDQAFEPNGIIPPRTRQLTQQEEQQISFTWGASTNAREALISLIELSGTTLRWDARCSVEPADQNCVLNLNPIQILLITPDGKSVTNTIYGDRSKKEPIRLPEN